MSNSVPQFRALHGEAERNRVCVLQVYAKNNLNKQATATELGISLKTLYNKLHKYEEERRMRAG
jgi:DNA-binding NtrC family response regulator